MKSVIIIFVPINVLYDSHMCVILFILQCVCAHFHKIHNYIIFKGLVLVCHCALLVCKSVIHVDFISLFVCYLYLAPNFPFS